jgi:hypothetical protein
MTEMALTLKTTHIGRGHTVGSDFILYHVMIMNSRVVSGTEQKNSTSPFLPWMY